MVIRFCYNKINSRFKYNFILFRTHYKIINITDQIISIFTQLLNIGDVNLVSTSSYVENLPDDKYNVAIWNKKTYNIIKFKTHNSKNSIKLKYL